MSVFQLVLKLLCTLFMWYNECCSKQQSLTHTEDIKKIFTTTSHTCNQSAKFCAKKI